jgi:Na+/H+-dicarboxylate symporter
MLLPVGRSGLAIAAGYLGLFGLVIFPLAFIGLIIGVLAIRDLKQNPEKHGMGRAIFGVVVGALWAVALVAFLVVGAVFSG